MHRLPKCRIFFKILLVLSMIPHSFCYGFEANATKETTIQCLSHVILTPYFEAKFTLYFEAKINQSQ